MAGLFDTSHQLLGVERGAAQRVAFRAYVGLIKRKPPGTEAEEFARLTRAYETLREDRRARTRALAERLVQAQPSESGGDSSLPERAGEQRVELFAALERGQLERVHRLLDALHESGSLAWPVLRTEPDPRHALWLFAQHIDRELLAGRGAALHALVTSSDFAADVPRFPGLEWLAYRVLAFSARHDVAGALQFMRAHPPPSSRHKEHAELWERGAELVDATATLGQLEQAMESEGRRGDRAKLEPGSALERALDVGFVAPPPGGELARALLRELGTDEQALSRLDELRAGSPAAFQRLVRTLEHWAPRDDRLWEELSAPEQKWVWSFAQELDHSLDRDGNNRLLSWALIPALVLCGYACFALGLGYGLLIALLSFLAYGVTAARNDRAMQRRLVRPLFVARLVPTGISPERVLECRVHQPAGSDDLGRMFRNILEDEALEALVALRRVQSALEQTPEPRLELRELPQTRSQLPLEESAARQNTART